MNNKFNKAAHNLAYYFRLCMEGSGLQWDSDNEVEIKEILEYIFEGTEILINDKIDGRVVSRYHAE